MNLWLRRSVVLGCVVAGAWCASTTMSAGVMLTVKRWFSEKVLQHTFSTAELAAQDREEQWAGSLTDPEKAWLKERKVGEQEVSSLLSWGVPEFELRALSHDAGPRPSSAEDLYGNWVKRWFATTSAAVTLESGEFADDPDYQFGVKEMYVGGLATFWHDGNTGIPDGFKMDRFERSRLDQYTTVNDFFTRRLKDRPSVAAGDTVLVSPADSMCFAMLDIDTVGSKKETTFQVKGERFNVVQFLSGKTSGGKKKLEQYGIDIEKFDGGAVLVFRLRPIDYHHFHFPFDGTIKQVYQLKGQFQSVDPVAKKYDPMIKNSRTVIQFETSCGPAIMVAVGALMVGKVVLEAGLNGALAKGDRMGHFEFGGSTVVVLLPAAAKFELDPALKSALTQETYVRVGQSVGKFKTSSTSPAVVPGA